MMRGTDRLREGVFVVLFGHREDDDREAGGVLTERRWRSSGILFSSADKFAPQPDKRTGLDSTPEQLNDVLYV